MTAGVTTGGYAVTCPHCGGTHKETCHRIRAIEYHENGTIKRVEFHAPEPVAGIVTPLVSVGRLPAGALSDSD